LRFDAGQGWRRPQRADIACDAAVGIGELALLRWRGQPIDLMQG
jgi:hypothetical protein